MFLLFAFFWIPQNTFHLFGYLNFDFNSSCTFAALPRFFQPYTQFTNWRNIFLKLRILRRSQKPNISLKMPFFLLIFDCFQVGWMLDSVLEWSANVLVSMFADASNLKLPPISFLIQIKKVFHSSHFIGPLNTSGFDFEFRHLFTTLALYVCCKFISSPLLSPVPFLISSTPSNGQGVWQVLSSLVVSTFATKIRSQTDFPSRLSVCARADSRYRVAFWSDPIRRSLFLHSFSAFWCRFYANTLVSWLVSLCRVNPLRFVCWWGFCMFGRMILVWFPFFLAVCDHFWIKWKQQTDWLGHRCCSFSSYNDMRKVWAAGWPMAMLQQLSFFPFIAFCSFFLMNLYICQTLPSVFFHT